jgi:hypothetical protein
MGSIDKFFQSNTDLSPVHAWLEAGVRIASPIGRFVSDDGRIECIVHRVFPLDQAEAIKVGDEDYLLFAETFGDCVLLMGSRLDVKFWFRSEEDDPDLPDASSDELLPFSASFEKFVASMIDV